MPDREKVIKGLEICSAGEWNSTGGRDHTDCPYYPAGHTGCTCKLLMRDALALLKEQEPVEPVGKTSSTRIDYFCGNCDRWFSYKSTIHPEMDFRTMYCPHCGRKVLWDA